MILPEILQAATLVSSRQAEVNARLAERFRSTEDCIEQVLLTEEAIQARVSELGAEISNDFPEGDLHLIAALKGAAYFLTDLSRNIPRTHTIDFLSMTSYAGDQSTGTLRIDGNVPQVEGRRVVFVEDILDTLFTSWGACDILEGQRPTELHVCTLLAKRDRHLEEYSPVLESVGYVGFEIPDLFVVGYGLDYRQVGRDLPHIGTLKQEVIDIIDEVYDTLP